MVTHHMPDEVLMAYSAGVLPESFSLVVASHVSLSDDSRSRLEAFDAIGGAILDAATPEAPVSDACLDATLARIMGVPPTPPAPKPAGPQVFPGPLRDYVGGDLDAVTWKGIGRGAKQAVLPTGDTGKVRLLYIPTGMAIPDHGHNGSEMALVLHGAYRDEMGEYHRGDVELADETDQHTPVAIGPDDCICLVATDARLRFTSFLPRLVQPFLGI